MNNKAHNIYFYLIVITPILLFESCTHSDLNIKYGVAFNQVRQNVGLSVLDSTWRYNEAVGVLGGSWLNPICPKDSPCYYKKSFLCDNDTSLIWEQDMYQGSQKYTTVDGTFNEELCITYYFKDKYLKYTWTKGLPHKDSKFYYECNDEITSTEADSLLTQIIHHS